MFKLTTLRTVLLLLSFQSVFAQDACIALLNHGLYDEIIVKGLSTNYSEIRDEFCSSYSSMKSDVQSGGAKASYNAFKGKASYSRQKLEQLGSYLCETNSNVNDIYSNSSKLQRLMNPNAVKAFTDCVNNSNNNLNVNTNFGSSAMDDLVISLIYKVSGIDGASVPLKGVEFDSDRLTCKGPLLDLLQSNSPVIGNSALSLTCNKKLFDEPKTSMDESYWYFGSSVTISTGAGTIVTRLPKIGVKPEPDPVVTYPVGMVITSVLPPEIFFSGSVTGIIPSQWYPVNGTKYPKDSVLSGLYSKPNYPDLTFLNGANVVTDIVLKVMKHGDNVFKLEEYDSNKKALKWFWMASNHDTKGNRNGPAPGHYEWSEDHFQHYVNFEDGNVIAQGRTHDFKVGWSSWGPGEANVLGLGTKEYPELYYYVKVN